MTETAVEVMNKIAGDATFRRQLNSSPDGALAPYATRLDSEEIAAFRAIASSIVASADSPSPPPAVGKDNDRRPSFKEIAAAVLSVILVLICIPVIAVTLWQVGANPTTIKVGDAVQVVDPFAQAKEVLAVVFPLLTAVVTFWLGVAVEGRRADTNAEAASQAKSETAAARDETAGARDREQQAAKRENVTKVLAVDAIGQVEGALAASRVGVPHDDGSSGMSAATRIERRGGSESVPSSAGVTAPTAPALDIEQLQEILGSAKRRLLG